MKKPDTILKETDNSRVYKMAARFIFTYDSYCKPHKGENRNCGDHTRSWKKHRKNQYKPVLI